MPQQSIKKHRADKGFREFSALNKLSAQLTGKYSESTTFFIQGRCVAFKIVFANLKQNTHL